MQSQDNNDSTPNRPSFENYRDPKLRGRKSHKVTSILKCDAHHHINMRRLRKMSHSRQRKMRYMPASDFPSSPRIKRTHFHCDNSAACNSKFKKREITTIHEEIIHFKSKTHISRKDKKAYQDKVASLKNIVKRLRAIGVNKLETVQNNLPEDVTQQFSSIKL